VKPYHRHVLATLAALPALLLLGCSGETTVHVVYPDAGSGTVADAGECEKGTVDCPCLQGDLQCRGDDLLCVGGLCRQRQCEVGEADCACYGNFTCNQRSDGVWLVCEQGLCREPSCAQGSLGCGCFAGGTCDAGLLCHDDGEGPRCDLPECTLGELSCGCLPDRTCGVDAQGTQLACEGRVCVLPTCVQGEVDCACLPDYSCNGQLRCQPDGRCGAPTCTPGDAGCGCLPDGGCNGQLLCEADGRCSPPNCPQGDEGCGCYADFTCNEAEDGLEVFTEAECNDNPGRCPLHWVELGLEGAAVRAPEPIELDPG